MNTNTIHDGGPAFPVTLDYRGCVDAYGMTLRDWFAGRCPDSEIPDVKVAECMAAFSLKHSEQVKTEHFQMMRSKARYAWADTMLSARKGGSHE